MTFDENVVVLFSSGTVNGQAITIKPYLELNIGGEAGEAHYLRRSGTEVVFAYVVQAGDIDENGIAIGRNKFMDAEYGTGKIIGIKDAVGGGTNGADLTHDALADDANHKVDGRSGLNLSGDSWLGYPENGEDRVDLYLVSGSDADITWSLSGDDSDDFSISKTSSGHGKLTFKHPPNYEKPTDADANNRYRVTVEASDGTNTGTRQVIVTVTNAVFDADEVPVIVGTARVGETLTVDLSNITYSGTTMYYLWERIDGDTETQVGEITDSSYTPTTDDVGKTIRLTLRVLARGYQSLVSEPTGVVVAEGATPDSGDRTNSPATGAPTISGTVQVGETLTADTSGIADADGTSGATFAYQWIRNDGATATDIAGATGSTYALAADDLSKLVKVRVSFTDEGGNDESLTSRPRAVAAGSPNTPATGRPTIRGTAQVGETLTADTPGIADADGTTSAVAEYQWMRSDGIVETDIGGATQSSYTLVSDDEGKTILLRVSFTDDAGHSETLLSQPTQEVTPKPNSKATGAPTISGTAQVGRTLTADTSGIADADGLASVTFRYQWVRTETGNGLVNIADIAGATGSSYTLVSDDEGKTIQVRVSFTDGRGHVESLTSQGTRPVAAEGVQLNSEATGAPTISGTAQVGETLTVDTSGISDTDGLTNVSYSYQWIRNGGGTDTDISGQTSSTYTLVSADEGKTIKVRVSFTDDGGNEESLTSASTAAVPPPPSTDATLSALTLSGVTFTFDSATTEYTANVGNDVTETKVTPTTNDDGATYVVKLGGVEDADGTVALAVGVNAVSVVVTAEDGQATKTYTVTVTRAEPPLTAEFQESPAAHDGTIPFTFRIAFSEDISTSYVTVRDHALEVTGGSVTAAWRVDRQSDLWGIRVQPDSDADVEIALPANRACDTQGAVCTDDDKVLSNRPEMTIPGPAPANAPVNSPATGAPTISGSAQEGQTLTADTSGIADADGLTNVSYSYQWIRSDGGTDTDISGQTNSTYTVVSADLGNSIKVRVSFTDDANNPETLTSAPISIVAGDPYREEDNNPATGAPTISGTVQVAKTLTASTSGIADADGLTNATFSYQWVVNDGTADTDISGATGSTYTLVDADEGKTVKVRVSFTDDGGNQESLTSPATASVAQSPSTDATLSALTLSGVNFSTFASGTTSYTASVGNGVTETTVTPTTSDDGATYVVKLGGAEDVDGTVDLAVGANTVSVVVTAEDGQTTKTYTVTVTRAAAPPSGDATLSGLTLSGVNFGTFNSATAESGLTLSGVNFGTFNSATADYTANVGNDVTETTVTATTNDDGATYVIKLDGTEDADGTVDLAVGSNAVSVVVTAEDGNTSKTYTVTVTRTAPPSDDATLSGLTLSGVNFGTFSSATTAYTASVAHEVTETTVTATANDGGASYVVKLGGSTDSDGVVSLSVGSNAITAEVTAEDGQTSRTYTVTITRADAPPSDDARLSTLALSGIDIGNFDPATTDYTASVGNDVEQTKVTATTKDGGATYIVKLAGVEDADGTVALAVGANAVSVEVTAEDGQTTRTYTVTVTRAGPPLTAEFEEAPAGHDGTNPFTFRIAFSEPISESWVTLRDHALEVTGGSVTGAWRVDQRSDLWGIRVQPDSDADVSIVLPADRACDTQGSICTEDGKILSNRPEMTVPGPVPANAPATGAPAISGTAQVGQTLTASTSGITDADGLANTAFSYQWIANDGTTDTDISGATATTYTLADADEGKSVKVRVTFTDDGGNEESLTSAATGAVAPPPSNDATLSGLSLSGVNFGTFSSATTAYTASVGNDVEQTTVTPTTNDPGASYVVKLGGVADADGQVSLAVGDNTISVVVTAEDGNTAKTYRVTVTRAEEAAPPSDDATLSSLTLSGVNFGAFNSATTEYTASVGNDVEQTTVTATVSDDGATYVVRLDGTEDADGTVDLAVGDNSVSVVVTAEDGQTTRTYTVTVTRAEAEADEEPALDGPQGPPKNFTGEVTGKGQVALDWDDVAGATEYQVQFWTLREQLVLPDGDIGIVFDGSSATVSGLPDEASWSFKVSADGGEWSPGWLTLENPYH